MGDEEACQNTDEINKALQWLKHITERDELTADKLPTEKLFELLEELETKARIIKYELRLREQEHERNVMEYLKTKTDTKPKTMSQEWS